MCFLKDRTKQKAIQKIYLFSTPPLSEKARQRPANVLQVSPTVPGTKNLNPNSIGVGGGVDDDVYITVTGEVLKIDQERGVSLVRKIDGATSWLSTKKKKTKKQNSAK